MSKNQHPAFPCTNEAISPGMTYRQLLVAQVAPVCVKHFLNDVDWQDYDDMAGSIMMMVDAIIAAERETTE